MTNEPDLGALIIQRRAGSHGLLYRRPWEQVSLRWHLAAAVPLSIIVLVLLMDVAPWVGVAGASLFLAMWITIATSTSYAFHERGVRVRGIFSGSRVLRLDDHARITLHQSPKVNLLRLEPAKGSRDRDVVLTRGRSGGSALEDAAYHYSRAVSERMVTSVLREGHSVHWLPGLRFGPDGLFVTRGDRDSRETIPYAEIGRVHIEEDELQVEILSLGHPPIRVDAGHPNVLPGRIALDLLCELATPDPRP